MKLFKNFPIALPSDPSLSLRALALRYRSAQAPQSHLMSKMQKFCIIFFLSIFAIAVSFPANFVFGAKPLEVVINEIAWMGTEIDGVESKNWWRYEWIELYNTSEQAIDLTGWKIENAIAKQGVLEIPEGDILPLDYFLICKKKIANCDLEISKLSLNNNYNENGRLILKDGTGNIIDQTPEPNNSNWQAGDNKTKQTMERKNSELSGTDPVNWQTSQDSGGTPRLQNTETRSPSPTENGSLPASLSADEKETTVDVRHQQPVEPKIIIYPSCIIINEILPSPEGADAENEWIEIFNQNNFEVDLSEWKITDTVGKTKIYTFPQGTKILPKAFLVLSRPETKITLNNSGDGLKLIQPDAKVVDKVIFGKATLGKSYSYFDTGWEWSDIPSPGSLNLQNIIPELKQAGLEAGRDPFSSGTDENGSRPNLASVGFSAQNLTDDKIPKPFLPILIASVLAIFSGIIIFFLKKNFKQQT